ncbi:hypothetical protein GQ457_11G026310 [Hibiscus cannabinus]
MAVAGSCVTPSAWLMGSSLAETWCLVCPIFGCCFAMPPMVAPLATTLWFPWSIRLGLLAQEQVYSFVCARVRLASPSCVVWCARTARAAAHPAAWLLIVAAVVVVRALTGPARYCPRPFPCPASVLLSWHASFLLVPRFAFPRTTVWLLALGDTAWPCCRSLPCVLSSWLASHLLWAALFNYCLSLTLPSSFFSLAFVFSAILPWLIPFSRSLANLPSPRRNSTRFWLPPMPWLFRLRILHAHLWVRIHNIPLSLMTAALARALGASVGKVIMTDTRMEDGNMYERSPLFCHGCGLIGHSVLACPTTPKVEGQKFQYGAWLRAPLPKRSASRPCGHLSVVDDDEDVLEMVDSASEGPSVPPDSARAAAPALAPEVPAIAAHATQTPPAPVATPDANLHGPSASSATANLVGAFQYD